ncbi:MAG TPA: zinc ribbon domain-containing protein [Solirubrobacterales bacterium]|nr:zinc ribbon domain-containing protein [Solirubrobacterales bacterium]
MDLRLDRLNSGEQIAGGSALALLVCMFFGWFNFGFETLNAWESLDFISPFLTVTIAATVGIAAMKAAGKSLGDIPTGSTIFVLGCLAFLFILFRLVDPVSYQGAEGFEPSGSVEAGIFLALLAAGGIVAGGYLATGGAVLDQLKRMIPQSAPAPTPQAPPRPAQPPVAPPPAAAAASPPPTPVEPAPAAPNSPTARFCEQCGATVSPEDRFCTGCGAEQAAS